MLDTQDDFDDKINTQLVDIFNLIEPIIENYEYKDVWFLGEYDEGILAMDFWMIQTNGELLMCSQKFSDHPNVTKLIEEVKSFSEIFSHNDMESFRHVLVKYSVKETISADVKFDYDDWIELGFDDLDVMNYYLVETVGENYIQGYPEKKSEYLAQVYKMQKHED